jgi:Uma2 family endonuclease
MLASRPAEPMSVEAFLDWLGTQDARFELVDGRLTAMAGGTVRHADVALNIIGALRRKLRGTDCRAYGSDVAVRTGPDRVRFPHAHVHCGPIDPSARVLDQPRVVFEVLSPSTERVDRFGKKFEYTALPSVDTYVVVHPELGRLDVYERTEADQWLNTTLLPGSTLALRDPSVGLTADEIFGGEA